MPEVEIAFTTDEDPLSVTTKHPDQAIREAQRSKPQTRSTSRRYKGKLVEGVLEN